MASGARESITDFEQNLCDVSFDVGSFLAYVKQLKTQDTNGQALTSNIATEALLLSRSWVSWFERFASWVPIPLFSQDTARAMSTS